MKIFITRFIPQNGIDMLRAKGYEVEISDKNRPLKKKELIKKIRKNNYDAVITVLTDTVDREVLSASPNVKIFANYAVGFNNIDLEAAEEKKVLVTNTPGASDESVAEHAVALMLALAHRIVESDQFVRDGKYKGWDPMLFTGFDLKGLTLGLVGAGRIGSHVAKICSKGFGMNIIYFDVVRNEEIERETGARYANNFEEILPVADVVSIHVPLSEYTKHLINAEHLKKMKPTAILINTARGPVIDECALMDALRSGTIRAAGIDVYEKEPEITKGLSRLDNVVLTPHVASATKIAREDMSRVAAENVIAALEGKIPSNLVK